MIAKVHDEKILAVCDKELLGKVLDNDGVPFSISNYFYGGEPVDSAKLEQLLQRYSSVNAIGAKTIKNLKDKGILDHSKIINIQGVPHAIVVR